MKPYIFISFRKKNIEKIVQNYFIGRIILYFIINNYHIFEYLVNRRLLLFHPPFLNQNKLDLQVLEKLLMICQSQLVSQKFFDFELILRQFLLKKKTIKKITRNEGVRCS